MIKACGHFAIVCTVLYDNKIITMAKHCHDFIAGNVLVVYVIMSHAFMRSHVHVLLVNLAVADIAFLVCCVPFQVHRYAKVQWVFGDAFCKITQFVIYVTLYVTIWTLVSIAVLRCYVVVWNKNMRMSGTRYVAVYTALLWLMLAALSLPYVLFHEQQVSGAYTYCGVAQHHERLVATTLFVSTYLLPFSLIVTAYTAVLRYLRKQSMTRRLRRRDTRVSRGIITVVACFVLAWFPYHAYSLVSAYLNLEHGVADQLTRIICHTLAFSNSLVNPFIYNYSCREFRRAFRHLLRCRDANCPISNKRGNANSSHFPLTDYTPRE